MKFPLYLALEASAGSGKTFALVVRFVALILLGHDTSKILALTFTKKAANEMKNRLINVFCELEHKESELNELCNILDCSKEEIIAKRDSFITTFLRSELKISTFDSFFTMILRQFSLNLGLMPDFEVGSNLKESVRQRFIDNLYKNGLLKAFAFHIKQTANSSKSRVFDTLETLYENLDLIDYDTNITKPTKDFVIKKFEELKAYAITISKDKNFLKNFDNSDPFAIAKKPLMADLESKKYFEKPSLDIKFMILREELKSLLKDFYIKYEKFRINELLSFLKIYKSSRFELLKIKNALNFSDVTKLVFELLSKNIDKDMLYFRLDGYIKHILIDEFQDTNVVQYEILLPLIDEALSGDGQTGIGSFFYVGDIKQSIYRFRGGKKELFFKLKEKFSQIELNSLDSNFRSSKNIVNFINTTFKDKIYGYKPQIPKSNLDGYVDIYSFNSENFIDILKSKIEFLHNFGIDYTDICILCWKNKDIAYIKESLELSNIPVSSQSSNLLINSLSVSLVISFMKYCIFEDKIYLQSVSEFLDYEPIRLNLKFNSNLLFTLKFIAKYLKIDPFDKNLLKLYEISLNYNDIFDFIFNIDGDETLGANSSNIGITIMTVHKSKGLEFSNVIVVDRLNKGNPNKEVFLTEYNDQSFKWEIKLNDIALKNLDDENFIRIKEKSEILNKEEDINKLYVALTRAKTNLIILTKSDPNGNNPSYFTAFNSNNKLIEYLDLKPIEIGRVEFQSSTKISTPNISKLLQFQKVKKQEVVNKTTSLDIGIMAAYFGQALHYTLEMMGNLNLLNLDIAKTALINKFGSILNEESINDICTRVSNLVKDEKFQSLISNQIILKEQDIAFNGVIKRIDLLCYNEKSIIVFDYKSSKKFIDENIEQVKDYVDSLKKIYIDKMVYGKIIYILKQNIEIMDI